MKYVFALLLLAGLALAEPESTPEADPAADAWYGYYGRGYGLGYRGYYGGYGGYYGGYRGYGGYGYGYYGRKKREADPAVLATTHSAPAVAPLVHPYGIHGYALGYGYGLHHAPTVGYTVEHKATEHIPGAVTAVAGEPTVVHVAAPYGYGYGYGYGLHHPLLVAAPAAAEEAAVTDARKKREADPEAEAEADPAVLYSGYYGHPHAYGYGLGGYYGGYGGYAGRGYYGYGGYGGYAYYG